MSRRIYRIAGCCFKRAKVKKGYANCDLCEALYIGQSGTEECVFENNFSCPCDDRHMMVQVGYRKSHKRKNIRHEQGWYETLSNTEKKKARAK